VINDGQVVWQHYPGYNLFLTTPFAGRRAPLPTTHPQHGGRDKRRKSVWVAESGPNYSIKLDDLASGKLRYSHPTPPVTDQTINGHYVAWAAAGAGGYQGI